ncbi:MAG: hypothetical protein ACE5PO_03280 [Candidatus Bathyarchaeia archaeon]
MRMNKRKGDISDLLYLGIFGTNLGGFLRTVDEAHRKSLPQKGELHEKPTDDAKTHPDANVSGLMDGHRTSSNISRWSDLVRESCHRKSQRD